MDTIFGLIVEFWHIDWEGLCDHLEEKINFILVSYYGLFVLKMNHLKN